MVGGHGLFLLSIATVLCEQGGPDAVAGECIWTDAWMVSP